jgi:hypothetical protein
MVVDVINSLLIDRRILPKAVRLAVVGRSRGAIRFVLHCAQFPEISRPLSDGLPWVPECDGSRYVNGDDPLIKK